MSLLSNLNSNVITEKVAEHQEMLDPLRQFIVDNFGQNGLYAVYFVLAAVAVLILYKLVKLSFDVVFFVALPASATAFILSLFLEYNFFYLLPVTAGLFTLGLVIKSVGTSKG